MLHLVKQWPIVEQALFFIYKKLYGWFHHDEQKLLPLSLMEAAKIMTLLPKKETEKILGQVFFTGLEESVCQSNGQ